MVELFLDPAAFALTGGTDNNAMRVSFGSVIVESNDAVLISGETEVPALKYQN